MKRIIIAAVALLIASPAFAQLSKKLPGPQNGPVHQELRAIESGVGGGQPQGSGEGGGVSAGGVVGSDCGLNMLTSINPATIVSKIVQCKAEIIVPDAIAALASAQAAKDTVGISCLQPGLAIIQAAAGQTSAPAASGTSGTTTPPATPPASGSTPADTTAPTTTPTTTTAAPGLILIAQKAHEFVIAGGPAACKTWVNSIVSGLNPLTN